MYSRNSMYFHVLDSVNGHTSHANIPTNSLVIGIVSAMSWQIESDAEALLPG